MIEFSKEKGSKIMITFDHNLIAPYEGQENNFTVTVPEYKFVPEGPIINVPKTVDRTDLLHKHSFRLFDLESRTMNNTIYVIDEQCIGLASYQTSGSVTFTIPNITLNLHDSRIAWTENSPVGTSIKAFAKVNNGSWYEIQNGGSFLRESLTNGTIYIRYDFTTTNTALHAKLYAPYAYTIDMEDRNKLVLYLRDTERFPGAVGDITVSYTRGDLMGLGGVVENFTETFTPEDLEWFGHPNRDEHLDISSATYTADFIAVTYSDYKSQDEHMDVNAEYTAVLTNIEDL